MAKPASRLISIRRTLHPVEQIVEDVSVLQPAAGRELPGFLTQRSVGLFEQGGHLHQGALLAAEVDRHGADQLLILLLELGELGLARDVRLAEQGAAIRQRPVKHRVAVGGQFRPAGCVEVAGPDRVLDRFELGLDVAHEGQVGRLALRVVGLTGHRDVPLDPFFAHDGIELAGGEQPALELAGGAHRLFHQLLVPRLDLVPGLELELFGKPLVGISRGNVTAHRQSPR